MEWKRVSARCISTSPSFYRSRFHKLNIILVDFTITHPWLDYSRQVREKKAISAEVQRKLDDLREEAASLLARLRAKDKIIQENNMKIELMETRMQNGRQEV